MTSHAEVTAVTEEPAPFTFDALDSGNEQFRLLELLPGTGGSNLECILSVHPLHKAPAFEALSYTWGDPFSATGRLQFPKAGFPERNTFSQKNRIFVNGKSADIGHNLGTALRAIRSEDSSRLLWIDALCIDQSKDEEKSQQILHMADIYRMASYVLIWLGPPDSTTDLAFDTVEEICWLAKYYIWQYCSERLQVHITEINTSLVEVVIDTDMSISPAQNLSPLRHIKTRVAKRDLIKALSLIELDFTSDLDPVHIARKCLGRDSTFLACLNLPNAKLVELPDFATRIEALSKVLFHRSYFNRLWILQEVHNSSHAVLLCGTRRIDFSMASLLVTALQGLVSSDGAGSLLPNKEFAASHKLYGAISRWITRYLDRAYKQERTLAHQIIETDMREFTKPHDAIYALLGLCLSIEILPEYEQPLSVSYAKAARAMISQQQDLTILCLKPLMIGFPEGRQNVPIPIVKAAYDRAGYDRAGFNYMFEEAQHVDAMTPTWVPVFSALSLIHGQFIGSRVTLENQIFKAGGGFSTHDNPLSVQDWRVLRLDGCFFDMIVDFEPRLMCFPGLHYRELSKSKFVPSSDSQYPTGESAVRAFWLTALMNLYIDNAGGEQSLESSREALQNFTVDIADTLKGISHEPTDRLEKRLNLTTRNKSFFQTTDKFMGQVLGNAQKGDQIFIARGSPVPFILRKTEDQLDDFDPSLPRSQFYTFVGAAYVHGIMYGQGLPSTKACIACKKDLGNIRYKCLICPGYELCPACWHHAGQTHPNHYLVHLKDEVLYVI